jgi:hypothetical protein
MSKLYQLISKVCMDRDQTRFNNILKLLCNINLRDIEDTYDNKEIPKCKICYQNNCNIVIIPCGHVCSCKSCGEHITSCPICRGECIRKQPLYFC